MAPVRLDHGGVVDTHAVILRRDRFIVEIEHADLQVMSAAGESGKRILDLQRSTVLAVVKVGQGDVAIETSRPPASPAAG